MFRQEPRTVEPLCVPEGSQVGERVSFTDAESCAPDERLNPKKKIWESVQVSSWFVVILQECFKGVLRGLRR